jgi:hypothetical protein
MPVSLYHTPVQWIAVMKIRALLILAWIVMLSLAPAAIGGSPEDTLTPASLRCAHAENPLGVDEEQPRLSWIVESARRGQKQTAYQILAAGNAVTLLQGRGDFWDSGRVASEQTGPISYGGKPLKSFQQLFWKVRVWDAAGRISAWSRPASWTMGILSPADWHAQWISSQKPPAQSLLLRREFAVKAGLQRAVVYVCGLGHYEMSINGRKVSDDLLAPGWSKYDKTCLYDTYDVTPMLRAGQNAAGLILGNGMYNVQGGRYTKFTGSFGPLKAIAQIYLEYGDGSMEWVGTDGQWLTSPGPITFSCVFGGEDHDARMEQPGWDQTGFDPARWEQALVMEGPGGTLKGLSCAAAPIRAFDTLKPGQVKKLKPGIAVYDLGQNAALMPRLKVKGPAGSIVRVIPAELVAPDGSVDRISSGGTKSKSYWQYTLAGRGSESWFPKFFYHGCRFLQVECIPAADGKLPVVQSLEGVVVHSASPAAGEFACSSDLFNRIRTLVRWAQRSNMMSVLTDCPHREKLGWLEQIHLNGPSLRYEFDLARLYAKSMNDMADSQLGNGLVPDIAPEYVAFEGGFRDSPEWGSALILGAWQQYEWTGDTDLLRRHYQGMKRYLAYLESKATDRMLSHGLGDWYDLGPKPPGSAQLTPIPVTATAFYFYDAWALSRIAQLLGFAEDAGKYAELAADIRRAFNLAFYDPQTRQYATGSQSANAIPLVMDIIEPANRGVVLDAVVGDVRGRGNALTAGDVGYRYLLRALAEGGRSDVIFDMNNQSVKPGYGYQLRQGATSLTEAWDARRGSSQNHFMLGHILEWFYHDLAGIGCDPTGPGFAKILIRPQPVGDLTWARASYNSSRGRIESAWKRRSGQFQLDVTIPANAAGTVFIPAKSAADISESGRSLDKTEGAKILREEGGFVVLAVESGRYRFLARAAARK